jgi:hypothetical protein
MVSGSEEGTQIYLSFLSKVPANEHLQVPQQGLCEKRGPPTGILHISQKIHLLGSPVKEPSLKVPLMESLTERCPTTPAVLHSSIKVLGIRDPPPPTYRVPLGHKRVPIGRDARIRIPS